jgi:ribosomal protein S6
MRNYDLVLVMRPSLKDADRKKLLDGIKENLKDLKVVKEEDWGQKPLAYTIKKELAGSYYQFKLEGENLPQGLEQKILLNENIIRHLLLRTK